MGGGVRREVFRTSGNLDMRRMDVRWMCGGCAVDVRVDVRSSKKLTSGPA